MVARVGYRKVMRVPLVVMALAVLSGLAVLAGLFLIISGHVVVGDVLTGMGAIGNGVIYAFLRSNRRRRSN